MIFSLPFFSFPFILGIFCKEVFFSYTPTFFFFFFLSVSMYRADGIRMTCSNRSVDLCDVAGEVRDVNGVVNKGASFPVASGW